MIRILQGDCIEMLATLPSNSVHCMVTSPPYYGLRDYGTAQWDGGDAGCDHAKERIRARRNLAEAANACDGGSRKAEGRADHEVLTLPFRDICGKCGATRIDRQIGLEATPDEYLTTMVAVFREVRRVLRDDGTCFVNIGDSYAGSGKSTPQDISERQTEYNNGQRHSRWDLSVRASTPTGLASKQLLMIPARLALALQADGWWIRSDIIWHKPNPMPESVTDRPTSAHEHVFLLTNSPKYFYDADAVREEGTIPAGTLGAKGSEERFNTPGVNSRPPEYKVYSGTRNLRNVWTIATSPYSDAHFATFPPALAERCIRAGTSERGCCAACGAPWVRQTERAFTPQTDVSLQRGIKGASGQKPMDASNRWDGTPRGSTTATTTGWAPSCTHDSPPVPCTVLDPFAGAFTAPMVADRLQRHAIGIELNANYIKLAEARIAKDAGLFADVVA